jgi:hypothetical protein
LPVIVAVLLLASGVVALVTLPHAIPGPPVECGDNITAADCRRAVDMARPLLSPDWEQASGVTVHIGPCSRAMKCPASVAANASFLTVELTSPGTHTPFVVIKRQRGDAWTAECRVMVYSGNSGSLATCNP